HLDFRPAAILRHSDGFLARPPNWQSPDSARKEALARRQRLHESQHARLFQVRKFSSSKFPMDACARGDHLSAAAPRHFAAGRHFLLHFPFAFLHARYLSRRLATNTVPARSYSRSLLFSAPRRRSNRSRP